MKLFLNEKEIDLNTQTSEIKFEQQATLQNFLDTFQTHYLNQRKLYIIDYQTQPQNLSARSTLSEIDALSIHGGSQKDLLQENLKELLLYLDNMGIFLSNKYMQEEELEPQELQSYHEGILWIQEATQNHQRYFEAPEDEAKPSRQATDNDDTEEAEETDYFAKLVALDPTDRQDLETILNFLAEIRDRAAARYQKLYISSLSEEEKNKMIADFKNHVPQFLKNLEEIAVQISAGDENQAIVSLHEISEQTHSFLSLLPQDEANEEKSRQLLALLEEILQALDSQDSVQAADMIDYDLRDFLQSLADL